MHDQITLVEIKPNHIVKDIFFNEVDPCFLQYSWAHHYEWAGRLLQCMDFSNMDFLYLATGAAGRAELGRREERRR